MDFGGDVSTAAAKRMAITVKQLQGFQGGSLELTKLQESILGIA